MPPRTPVRLPTTSLFTALEAFPLGRAFGLQPESVDPTPAGALPFGLRLAVRHPAVQLGGLSQYEYDHARQVGVIRTEAGLLPLARHTTGRTRTTTNPDGHKGPDTDTDYRED